MSYKFCFKYFVSHNHFTAKKTRLYSYIYLPGNWKKHIARPSRHYTKNGELIPTAKKGKEIQQQWKQVQYIARYFGLKNKPSTRAKRKWMPWHYLAPVEGLFFKPKYRAIYCTSFNFTAVVFPSLSSPRGSVYRFLYSIFWFSLIQVSEDRAPSYVPVKSKLKYPPGHTPGIWRPFLPGREGIWLT